MKPCWTVAALSIAVHCLPAQAAQTRCGWLENLTPRDWTLVDRDGAWLLMRQDQISEPVGMDLIPDLTTKDWVASNGPAGGYACACLSVDVSNRTRRITRIMALKQKPIAACQTDPNLPKR